MEFSSACYWQSGYFLFLLEAEIKKIVEKHVYDAE